MSALKVKRSEKFSEWYQELVLKADLAENSDVRGCMVIKPYGYAIWERMQRILDNKFKELGHLNAYFPLFIPIDLFEKETEHVAGFAKEMAIVTHHKLEKIGGKLVPSGKLETPLAVRPTSEMIIGKAYSRWVKSYRDLPIMINQWANVVRWEMRTRLFLRTSEFLWQEGHTAHATEEEAIAETKKMHEVYRWFIKDVLKMYAIPGRKPDYDRFAGAIETYTVESIMQDCKALQSATSHYLGQNFAKATNIQFQNKDGKQQYAYTTSWGASTRLIGGLIMSHGDDDGLNLPSEIAPYHVVIIPLLRSQESTETLEYCEELLNRLQAKCRVLVDTRDDTPQNKKWNWIRKGVPFICEIGQREVKNKNVFFTKRADNLSKETVSADEFINKVNELISVHDDILTKKITDACNSMIVTNIKSYDEMEEFFKSNTGFVKAKWAGLPNDLNKLEDLSVSIRCIPSEQSGTLGKCFLTGTETMQDVIISKSY